MRSGTRIFHDTRLCILLAFSVLIFSGVLRAEEDGQQQQHIEIDNQKFYVDGEEFFVRGMVYRPTPLGIQGMNSGGWGGGGFCSAKFTAYNEWKSNCHDRDYYDGSSSTPGRVPQGPSSWFLDVWKRDLPIMQDMGVNVLRLYQFSPITSGAGKEGKNSIWNVTNSVGKNHVPFMDMVNLYKMKVMVPLISDYDTFMSNADSIIKQMIMNIIDEVGGHPALFSYVVGTNWILDSAPLDRFEMMIQFVKDYQRIAHGRAALVTHCTSQSAASSMAISGLSIDYLCVNDGWSGPIEMTKLYTDDRSDSLASTARAKKWPIVIGEMGIMDLSSEFTEINPTWFNSLWSTVVEGRDKGSAGAVYFEYCDQPQAQEEETHSSTCGVVQFRVKSNNVLSSVQPNVFWTDEVVPKMAVFNSIKNGSLHDIPINYRTTEFESYLQQSRDRPLVPLNSTSGIQNPDYNHLPAGANVTDDSISASGGTVTLVGSGSASMFGSMPFALCSLLVVSISLQEDFL